MVSLPASGTTGAFHTGLYNETQAADVKSLEECNAACLSNEACVQITWADRPVDPCVMYHVIYEEMTTVPGAVGWVKCAPGAKDSNCAHVTPKGPPASTRCSLYTAIDLTAPVNSL